MVLLLLEAVEASRCRFFENWLMKHKFFYLLKPLGTIIQKNYWSSYPSELIYFIYFTMRHPVCIFFLPSWTKWNILHTRDRGLRWNDKIYLTKILFTIPKFWFSLMKTFCHLTTKFVLLSLVDKHRQREFELKKKIQMEWQRKNHICKWIFYTVSTFATI